MISFEAAYRHVMQQCRDFGTERVPLKEAGGRILADDIAADRDFPPFDRATKDGIVINFDAIEKGRNAFEVDGILAAGTAAGILKNESLCLEIMTGAVIPYDADTVVMYEDLDIRHGIAHLKTRPHKGQNIHRRGSDKVKGAIVLQRHTLLAAADIAILASVGYAEVPVKKLPRIAVISSGDELVEVEDFPLPHQVRRSNAYQLYASLRELGISALLLHMTDDKDIIRAKLAYAVESMDVLLLSGGVSKGKFDYIPGVLSELGIEKIFHKVLQRPGKPFWFGEQRASGTLVFSFPGNPVSTFVCYYGYFRDWLLKSLGLSISSVGVILSESILVPGEITRLIAVKTHWDTCRLMAVQVTGNGSGDLTSLADADGLICLHPREEPYNAGNVVPFIPTRKIL
jgi:molybdopterin molybdotransferase